MTPRRPAARGLAALLTLALAACGTTTPTTAPPSASGSIAPAPSPSVSAAPSAAGSSSPSSSAAATPAAFHCSDESVPASFSPVPIVADSPDAPVLDKIEAAVQAIRGITATKPVPRSLLDQASLCAFLRKELERTLPPAYAVATEHFYQQLGLLAPGVSLRKLYIDLQANQVVGFYDENSKQMYVVSTSGGLGPAERFTYAHEYDHALEDQAYNLKTFIGDATDQTDRHLARLALAEGDATLLMSLWAQTNLTPAELIQVAGAAGPASQAALDAAPPILRESMMWPYTAGLSLALSAYTPSASFAGVDALWKNPPDTTAQVLHADKLASRQPATPVAFPADFAKRLGTGYTVPLQDTLGEVELNIVMRSGDAQAGTDPAAGWAGDRVALVEGPGGAMASIIDTSWDTPTAASNALAELQKLAQKLTAAGKHATALMPSESRVVLVSADSGATLSAIANVLGLAG